MLLTSSSEVKLEIEGTLKTYQLPSIMCMNFFFQRAFEGNENNNEKTDRWNLKSDLIATSTTS